MADEPSCNARERQCPNCRNPAVHNPRTTPGGDMTATTALRPHAGFQVTVTRPDGVAYPAHLCRFDGPHAGIAVLYTNPGDTVGLPDDVPLYEHLVYVEELAEGCQVHTLHYTPEQQQHVLDCARRMLDAVG